jgi:hypothetical protein
VKAKRARRSTRAGWRQVLAAFGSPSQPRSGPEDERLWLGRTDWLGIQLWLPRAPTRVVICPKTAPVGWWLAAGGIPSDLGFACTAHPVDGRSLRILEQVLPLRSRAVFVGDLDPLAIVQYVELTRSLARRHGHLLYGGLDDAWMAAMRRDWAHAAGIEAIRIALDPDERRLLAKLDGAIDLERLVGPRSAALLRGGHKIELEAATNPVFYRDGYARWAFRYLSQVRSRKSA